MDDIPQVTRPVLEPLTRIGDGGQGVVYATDRIRINKVWAAAYKEYRPETVFDRDVLHQMVAFVPSLDELSGRWLCENTAWPAALVLNSSQVSGFLMRRVPDRFRMPWGDNGIEVPAALQYLLNPQAYLNRKGIRLDTQTRLKLLEAIADVMARLHSLNIVVGDLSPNNLLIDLDDPACFFIDCDAMRLRGRDVLEQVETPEWNVRGHRPEPRATMASDSYKFGLLAARLFTQDQMGADVTVLAGVSGELGVLARRSLDSNSTIRPSMGDWLGALRTVQAGGLPRQPSAPHRVTATPRVTRRAAVPPPPVPPPPKPRAKRYASTPPPSGTTYVAPAYPFGSTGRVQPPSSSPPPPPRSTRQPASGPQLTPQQQAAADHPTLYLVLGLLFWVFAVACVVGVIWGLVKLF
ncbi:hypothetical protein ACIA5C_31730 [Actinoplanes sp. NPDC051343]|uniref:hypothetical protein n=1 Tax=Actinoplanes sp. NPDC051343 TaxID=3363906 RepID=UPI0037B996EE